MQITKLRLKVTNIRLCSFNLSLEYRVMHQICDWAKYYEFMLYVVTFEPMKIPALSAPQNDCPEPYFCERYKHQCLYSNWLQS